MAHASAAFAPGDLEGASVGFLFNHYAPHQVAHAAPIAFELSRRHPECAVVVMTSSSEQAAAVAHIAERFPGQSCTLLSLEAHGALARLARRIGPIKKFALLRSNADYLDHFTALVVPEKTSLVLRSRLGCARPLFIHSRHGAGDRAVGFDPRSNDFDLVLLSGEKIRRRLAAAGALGPDFAIVGYPKFDAIGPASPRPALFRNGRPTVLYNPHFSPELSSWYPVGLEILEWFRRSDRFNLIFAPHVMLFRRRLQICLSSRAVAWARRIPRAYYACEHLHIDLGSEASTDMTYTRAADVYLGDVSSQVCEFLVRPRPCLFANPRGIAWQGDPNFEAWRLGPVFEDVRDLGRTLDDAIRDHPSYAQAQRAYVAETFDLRATPSSTRAADAIAEFLAKRRAAAPSLRAVPQ